jgi:hypothetical protein
MVDPVVNVSAEIVAGSQAVRTFFSSTVFNHLVSDEVCREIAEAVVYAVEQVRRQQEAVPPATK